MNRQQAYAEALAIANGKVGQVSTLQPKDMTTDQAITVFHFLRQANFLDLVGHTKTEDGIYPANGWNKDQEKVYSQLVRIMHQTQVWGNQRHVTPFEYAPTGRRYTHEELMENGVHHLDPSNSKPLPGSPPGTDFPYYKGNN